MDEKELRRNVQDRLPALKRLFVLDRKGREVFSYGRKSAKDKKILDFMKKNGFPKGFRQSITFYDDEIVIAILLDKGYVRAVYPTDVNITRNLLRLRELERIIWG